MTQRRRVVPSMYRAARLANDLSAIASGSPRRMARRAKNHILGRLLRPLFWRLWR